MKFGRTYSTLNEIHVSSSALLSNYTYFLAHNPSKALIAPVLKSNAYGHGLVEVARVIDESFNAPFICVDSLYEAYELKKAHIQTPILVIGYTAPVNFKTWRSLSFHLPVFDEETLSHLHTYQPGVKVHIKIDTGMNRLGIKPDEIDDFALLLKKYHKVTVVGIYSHLFCADEEKGDATTKTQLQLFKASIQQFEELGFSFRWKHLGATAGASVLHDSSLSMHRVGLGIYGLTPFSKTSTIGKRHRKHLTPALRLTSRIAQIKQLSEGESVGYGATYTASSRATIAVLPIGYYDGVPRSLSNMGTVVIRDTICPIVGRICMNIMVIDITKIPSARVGDRAVLIDTDYGEKHSLEGMAAVSNTIPYEIMVRLAESTRRTLVE